MPKFDDRWTLLDLRHTADLYCQAVDEEGFISCPNPVEWEFEFDPTPLIPHDSPTPIHYCTVHMRERSSDPKWWSLRFYQPSILLLNKDCLAKAYRSVQPECHTCTSLTEQMMGQLADNIFPAAHRRQHALITAKNQLDHYNTCSKEKVPS